jgi:nuclease S1
MFTAVFRISISAAVLLVPLIAQAWGATGHRLIADLAYQSLPPSTRTKVDLLLAEEPGATLTSVATWADEVRSPTTAAWHYVNFPRGEGCHFDDRLNCPGGQCVVGAIERELEVLASSRPASERFKALKWVVHLVADSHQPLHAGFADDKGGNLVQVRAFGRGSNLHAVWDGGMIQNWPGGLSSLREHLLKASDAPQDAWSPRRWVEESCRIASDPDFYPQGRFITEGYVDRWGRPLASRLRLAADRLARVLQRALP